MYILNMTILYVQFKCILSPNTGNGREINHLHDDFEQ